MDGTHAHRDIGLACIFLDLVLQLLLEAEAAVAYEDVVHLLEVEVDVIVMVRVLSPVLLAPPLLLVASGSTLHLLHVRARGTVMRCEAILSLAGLVHAVLPSLMLARRSDMWLAMVLRLWIHRSSPRSHCILLDCGVR